MDDLLRRNRKYTVFWGVLITATVLSLVGKLTHEYVTLISSVFGLYMAGNVGEHTAKAWENRAKPEAHE